MKPIRLTKHAQEQCIERGTNEQEIIEAIRQLIVITLYTYYSGSRICAAHLNLC